ncbi:hypothetical protein ES705_22619 [subsurface metagenome]
MTTKLITLRNISTGGLLVIEGKNADEIIKRKGLDPLNWEEFRPEPESEDAPVGED